MRLEPGFVSSLREELAKVPEHILRRVERKGGMSNSELLSLVQRPTERSISVIEDAEATDFQVYDNSQLKLGSQAFERGEVAVCFLAGGSDVLQHLSNGLSLLNHRLSGVFGVPSLLMINPGVKDDVINTLNELKHTTGIFYQFEGYQLTPDNRLLCGDDGLPVLAPLGTGDLPPAMLESGVIDALQVMGVKYVFVSNLNNLGFTLDESMLGLHIHHHNRVTVQVVEKKSTDTGGVVVWADGKLQVVESFMLPDWFDGTTSRWLNTNYAIVDLDVIKQAATTKPEWFRVRKHVDNKIVVRHQRPFSKVMADFNARFMIVPREYYFRAQDAPA